MKPESRLIKAVHDLVHPDVEREKMHNVYRGGTADVWYSGYALDMWIEWKWVAKFPKHVVPDLSGLQKVWLGKHYERRREVYVVVGSPTGCIVFVEPEQWLKGIARDEAQVLSKQQIATWIQSACGLEHSAAQQLQPSTSTA